MKLHAMLIALAIALLTSLASAEDWPQFRGPNGAGISSEQTAPLEWSSDNNIAWKVATPGYGSSEPVVVGGKIFLTCYSGYGQGKNGAGSPADLTYHVVCMNRADGLMLWDAKIPAAAGFKPYKGFLPYHGYASSTPCATKDAVYCFFGNTGVLAFDHDGKKLWDANVGNGAHNWGSGASPILYKNVLIVNASIESGSLVGLDAKTGTELWRQGGISQAWSTPALVQAGGRTEVVVSARNKLAAFDPEKGTPLWNVKGIPDYICSTPATKDGIVYIIGGRRNMGMAVRAGGSGDVTNSHVLWTCQVGSNVGSPTLHNGYLHWIHDSNGQAICVNAENGEVAYRQRLDPKADKAYGSPTVVDNRLYVTDRAGMTFVLAPGPEFKLLKANSLRDGTVFNASPVANKGQLLIRSDKFLYCVGK